MQSYRIRRVIPEDLFSLLQLCREHAAYEEAVYTENSQQHELHNYLFKEPARMYCLVAEDAGGELVGYCTYMPELSTWNAAYFIHMDCLYLRPEVRRQGIGTEMIKMITEHAREMGVKEIQWQTPEQNSTAIQFYTAIGASGKHKVRFFLDTFNNVLHG